MSLLTSIRKEHSIGGKSFSESKSISGDAAIVHEEAIAAADPGALTTRTDADTGVVTVDESGHGITDSDEVDVYWDGGCRRGMPVSSVSGALVTIDGGSGDDLPTQDTVVAIVIPFELDVTVLGTNVKAIVLFTQARGQFVFEDAGGEELAKELGDAVVWAWHDEDGTDNPITGDSIIVVKVSHDDTTQSRTMRVGILYDND
jgi:hypothetical protein